MFEHLLLFRIIDACFLIAQPQAGAVLDLPSVFFFSFVCNYIQTSTDDVISSQLKAICRVFSSYPPSGAFYQVSSEINYSDRTWPSLRNIYLVQIGGNPWEMHVRTFERIKNVT